MIFLFFTGVAYSYIHNLLNSTIQDEIGETDEELGIGNPDFEFEQEGEPENEYVDSPLPFFYEEVKGITNIALFGVDAPIGEKGRSDAIMIVTIDRNSKKIKLSSVIRDSYVNIPGRGMDKINHAYAFGGPELAIKTLNSNFHLNIKNYATLNFTTLPRVIEALGGVTITITDAEATQIPGINAGGTYNLTGDQALTYVRIRQIDSDFARSDRQRTVVEATIKKMLSQPVTSYPRVLSKILPLVTTNMNSNDILTIAGNVVASGIRTIDQKRFPEDSYSESKKIKGIYYFVFNREKAIHNMGNYIYLDEELIEE
ncbi:LCP family protein [Proteiniclasticum ruminis]|nr:LCP family protein [Proteiniclasticum ruminis]